MIASKLQVEPKHYFDPSYDTKDRFISYWHQIDEIIKLKPKNVLEIGIGNGFVSNYLKARGVKISTLDLDKRLKPTKVGSVLNIPFKDHSFDVVACYEVLEHLPFERFESALSELKRVSSKYIVLSLPDSTPYLKILFHIPFVGTVNRIIELPFLAKKHIFDGQHYWEIGKKGFYLKKIVKMLRANIIKIFKDSHDSYHRFLLLSIN